MQAKRDALNSAPGAHLRAKRYLIFLLWSGLGLSACNFYDTKNSGGGSQAATVAIDPKTLSYAQLNTDVFQPSCVSCHSSSHYQGDVILDSYAQVSKNISDVNNQAIVIKLMPQGGSLTGTQYSELAGWISVGAPEQAINP